MVTSRETAGLKPAEAEKFLKDAEKALLDGDIDMIVTVGKLAEGWNYPPVNAVIWARATSSPKVTACA